jgi:hypothetical protein
MKGLEIAKRSEVGVVPGLRPHVWTHVNRPPEPLQSGLALASTGVHGGQQVERQVLIRDLVEHTVSESFGFVVATIVERRGGGGQFLFGRSGCLRRPSKLAFAELDVYPGAFEQGSFTRELTYQRPESFSGDRKLMPLKGLHGLLETPDALARRYGANRRVRPGGGRRNAPNGGPDWR